MSESPTDNSLDTAEIAAALVATEQTDGVDAMLTRLEETLRAQRRWHGLFDTRVLRARALLGLPLAGPLTDVDADRRSQLDEQTIAACREAGWGLFDEGQVAAGWVYLRAAVDRQEVATRLGQAADRLLAPTGADLEDEDYQPLQELVQLALWEGLNPALGIRITLATQGTCNAVTAYEQSVAGLPPAQQEPVAALMVEHLHAELLDNLSRDLRDRSLVPAATLDEIHAADGDVSALMTAAGGLTDDASIHLDASHLQAVLRFARICTAPAVLRKALALATYACRLPDDFRYPGDPPFTDFGTASRLFFAALLGDEPDKALAWFRDVATAADSYDAPAAWDVVAVLAARLNRPAEAMAAVLARPADTTPTQPAPLTMMLPPLVELAHAADAGAALRAACLDRDDLITFAASLARDATR